MFGVTLPPGIDTVRICALSGQRGKPPCLWEGPPTADQASIESAIGRDKRIIRWLRKNGRIRDGIATLRLQLECFSQGKRADVFEAEDVSILVARTQRKQVASEEAVVRAFDMAESMVDMLKEMLDDRDTIIGRLVERGLKGAEPVAAPTPPPSDALDEFLDKSGKFLSIASSFKALRGNDD